MNLSRNTWHARWYFFVRTHLMNKGYTSEITSLCPYMRTCLLWGPLILTFWTSLAGLCMFFVCSIFYMAINSAIRLDHAWWVGPLVVLGCIIALCAVTAGIMAVTIYTFKGIRWLRDPYRPAILPQDNFVNLGIQYVAAIKGRFCPIIRFVEDPTPYRKGQVGNPD